MGSNTQAATPAYQLVSDQLRREIAEGQYRDGVRLPTEAELAEAHGVSRQTVRRAFQDLVAEGIVYRVPGRGTFANEDRTSYRQQVGSIEDLLGLSADTTMEIVSPLRRGVHIEAASRLRLNTDLLHTLVLRRVHNGVPFALTTVYLPERVATLLQQVPELAAGASSRNTVIGLLESRLNPPIVEAAQSITVARASEEIAEILHCEVGHPLLRVDRLYSDEVGEPADLSVSYFVPEYYTHRSSLRRQ